MDNFYYNILWIDDEHEMLGSTKGRAKRNGIILNPFKSLEAGMSELGRNYTYYDGVLLDAKFFENEGDASGSEDTSSSFRAKEQILQLPKKFEIFVLTGQAEAFEDSTYNKVFSKVYEKGKDEEMDRLFDDIKKAAEAQPDTQIRFKYKRVFDVCTEQYIGETASQDLLKLLKDGEEANLDNDLNTIRKLVEDLFMAFHSCHLLPSDFVTSRVSLNESSKFLAGKNNKGETGVKGYTHLEDTHLPDHIAGHIKGILSITQSGSHRSEIDKYAKEIKSPYLFKSVLYQLMDVLVWFKMYVDSGPKKNNWIFDNEKFLPGKVLRPKMDQAYAFFAPNNGGNRVYISKDLVDLHGLSHEMLVLAEVEEFIDTDGNTTKWRVKRIQI